MLTMSLSKPSKSFSPVTPFLPIAPLDYSSDLGPGLPAWSPVALHFGSTLEKVLKYKACGSLAEILMLLVCGATWALEGFVCLFFFIVIK